MKRSGSGILEELAGAAAARAKALLGEAPVLAACDDVWIGPMARGRELDFEAWPLREKDGRTLFAAFAMFRDSGGREHVAASGRFAFSPGTG